MAARCFGARWQVHARQVHSRQLEMVLRAADTLLQRERRRLGRRRRLRRRYAVTDFELVAVVKPGLERNLFFLFLFFHGTVFCLRDVYYRRVAKWGGGIDTTG